MARRLQRELQQRKPFATPQEELVLNILRTADVLQQALERALHPAGLSGTQYNVLRILRGAGARGLCCREVGERMLTHDPDVTRLLDRLEGRGLVVRRRDQRDRRILTARLTPEGMALLASLDAPIAQLHTRLLGHLRPERQAALLELLEAARGGAVTSDE
ncbi:MAG: MarR family transcriptional regulator [Acidobacteriia bacterium]|nr:MarR family transcriptional regulator [Terriglobia bacterium]